MVQQFKHPSNCEQATGHECKCTYCYGTLHGWPGAVEIAIDPSSERRSKKRRAANSWWQRVFKKTKKGRTSGNLQEKGAAVDLGRADLIDWMAKKHRLRASGDNKPHPSSTPPTISGDASGSRARTDPPIRHMGEATPAEVVPRKPPSADAHPLSGGRAALLEEPLAQQVKLLGELLVDDVFPSVQQEVSETDELNQLRSAGLDHFWCDLFAHLAHLIDSGLNIAEGVPDRLTKTLVESRHGKSALLSEKLIELVARKIWEKLLHLIPIVGQLQELLPAVRILAVMICKAPERHEAVTRYCLDPLVKQLSQEALSKLVTVLRDWLPRCVSRADAEGIRQLPLY